VEDRAGAWANQRETTSDFSPAFIPENMQMVTDAAVRGLKMPAYTKDLDFVRIFAGTGMNINVSTFGMDGGDGKVRLAAMQGADRKEAQELRKNYLRFHDRSLLNDALDLLPALADIRVDELALGSGLCVGGHGDRLGVPIPGITVRRDVRDVMPGKIVPQVLHGLLVVRHQDVDVEPILRQFLVDCHCEAASEAAGDGNGDHGHAAVGSNDLLRDAVSDIVGNSQGRSGQDASPVLDQNGLGSAERVVQDLCEEEYSEVQ